MPFIHLRCHTNYSIGESTLNINSIANLCKKNEMFAVATTDTNNMFSVREFSSTLVKNKIKPIIGISINTKYHSGNSTISENLILLAKNKKGYQNLLALHKIAYQNYSISKELKPFVEINDIVTYSSDIICLTGGIDGLLAKSIEVLPLAEQKSLINILNKAFTDNLYIELNRLFTKKDYALEPKFLAIAKEYNLPIVATNNVSFATEEDYQATEILVCIGLKIDLADPKRKPLCKDRYFKSSEEMENLFKDLPEAIENTVNIAKRCSFYLDKQPINLPSFSDNEDQLIKDLARNGLKERLEKLVYPFSTLLKEEIDKTYTERLEFELETIVKIGFAGYFLIVSDFIIWAKQNNIAVGPGRGSGAGSLVAWALFIIDVDPIKYNLFFERFLNPHRISMPDFDIDFCQDNRDKVIDYVRNKYGLDKVANIITFGTLQSRAAIKDVGRVLGILYSEVDELTKKIPYTAASNPLTLQQIVDSTPTLQEEIKNHAHIKKLIEIALKLEGLHRNISTHAAGIIISKEPIQNIAPLYFDNDPSFPTVGFSMKYIEDVGLIKFDFLALKTLNLIQNTVTDIKKYNDVDIDILTIKVSEDQKITTLLSNGDTFGIFQLEGSGMTEVIKHIKPDRIEDVIAIISLYRPGPMENIPTYIDRRYKKEAIEYLHAKMQPILEETYGIMIYQEQVMEIAKVIAGYSLGEADILRRAMGKKDPKEMLSLKKIFIEGSKTTNDIDNKLAEAIFNQMERFAGYGFNKSHSTAYAMLSWQTAYLKAHYPAEFLANSMSLEGNSSDKFSLYLQEANKFNILILPPSVNNPSSKFSIETIDGVKNIRYSLYAIKGLGEGLIIFIKDYIANQAKFQSIENFLTNIPSKLLNKKQLEALILSGALDEIYSNRNELLQNVDRLLNFNQSSQTTKNDTQASLFGTDNDTKLVLVKHQEFSEQARLSFELATLGCFLSGHPLNQYKEVINNNDIKSYNQIIENKLVEYTNGTFNPKSAEFLVGYLMKIKLSKTRTGAIFASLTFYDQGSIFNVILFGKNYTQYEQILAEGKIYIIKAFLKIDNDETKFFIDSLQEITHKYKKPKTKSNTLNNPNAELIIPNNSSLTNNSEVTAFKINEVSVVKMAEDRFTTTITLISVIDVLTIKNMLKGKLNNHIILQIKGSRYLIENNYLTAEDISTIKTLQSVITIDTKVDNLNT